jgi:hypothetical protein
MASSISAWQRFGYAAQHLHSQQVNIDKKGKTSSKRAGVQDTLQHNQPLLENLLEAGKQHLKHHINTMSWPVAYAQACGLYSCASKSLGRVLPGSVAFDKLVHRCVCTAAYLVQIPLRVQPEDRRGMKRKQAGGEDGAPGEPFSDTSKSAIRLHGCMIAREIVVSLAEAFPHNDELTLVEELVYERVVESDPSIDKHSIAIDEAIKQLRVRELRSRMHACLTSLRC